MKTLSEQSKSTIKQKLLKVQRKETAAKGCRLCRKIEKTSQGAKSMLELYLTNPETNLQEQRRHAEKMMQIDMKNEELVAFWIGRIQAIEFLEKEL